jgi:hypothetical protein
MVWVVVVNWTTQRRLMLIRPTMLLLPFLPSLQGMSFLAYIELWHPNNIIAYTALLITGSVLG